MGRAFDTFKKVTLSIIGPVIGLDDDVTDEKNYEDITHILKLLSEEADWEVTQNCCIGSFIPIIVSIILICVRLFKRLNGKDSELADMRKETESLLQEIKLLKSKIEELEGKIDQNSIAIEDLNMDARSVDS